MVKSQNLNSTQEAGKEKMQVSMETVKYYSTKKGGLVIVYKVTPPSDSVLEEFYVVSFDDTASEQAWGLGYTPEDALEDAARKWNLVSETEEERKDNPFKEVLA
jgi:hypothetical protein